ncbi:unnamed protein product [Didymodactylos carnosus]|uniref:P-type H(+)-exporting transporter n=1 Tax=Didymodactylos carnosus TaxID=1234261 RepID=A0A814IIT8_9BILA|nr:unnamed protein product [Didymodactylos carnosus]CAF3795945.1 unnamed protein product [Didymodactylos carnosus]
MKKEKAIALLILPTVLSVTLAIGAKELSEKKAIVTRIEAIEELAGVTILCSDKTGTLTENKLVIDKPTIIQYGDDVNADQIIQYAAYACNLENPDPIDECVTTTFGNADEIRKQIEILNFVPFDPENKRTEITYRQLSDNQVYRVTKGSADIILNLCTQNKTDEQEKKLKADVDEFAKRGLRSLAVAIDTAPKDGGSDEQSSSYKLIGLLPIMDPPREDTAETIRQALDLGVKVTMITGDQLEIAKETGRRIGLGDSMLIYSTLEEESSKNSTDIDEAILQADGFAAVTPEHKYDIVKRLQDLGHLVAMTGDGVNDAPALSKSNVGIAVASASDAARSAAAIVLTEPGLGVIIDAINGSRQIFQRMKTYSVYTCAVTIRILVAILNDGTIMTISKDRVIASAKPNHWNMFEIFSYAIVYGIYLALSTLVFFAVIVETNFFQTTFGVETFDKLPENGGYNSQILNSIIYLQVSTISQALIFVTRTPGFFFSQRPSLLVIGAFVITQTAATFIAVYVNSNERIGITGCGWTWAGIVWIWNIIWFIPLDLIKFCLQAIFAKSIHAIQPFNNRCRAFCRRSHRQVQESSSDNNYPTLENLLKQTSNLERSTDENDFLLTKFDEFSMTGANFYSFYTEPLDKLKLSSMAHLRNRKGSAAKSMK